jgi:hypothetical protein
MRTVTSIAVAGVAVTVLLAGAAFAAGDRSDETVVDAPGAFVETGNGDTRVEAPFTDVDTRGGETHIRAPFVDITVPSGRR